MAEIKPGVYRHYKGHEYKFIGVAKHSETMEELVIYEDITDPLLLWARPKEMFLSDVEYNGQTIKRFTWIRE
ncbi:MAG: DUF1653 domain-containing protein [Parcubacteria group bacterium]